MSESIIDHLSLAMIKPHAVRARKVGEIISRIEDAGFAILIVKSVQIHKEGAEFFYAEHKGKDFFKELVALTCSGPVWPMVVMKHDGINAFRELIGNCDSSKAKPGTIRHDFGDHNKVPLNAIHGSDSDVAVDREIKFFFDREINMAQRVEQANDEKFAV